MPSPSASVVVSVATVVEGGAPMKTPPPTLPATRTAESDWVRSPAVTKAALMVGSLLRVVTR